VPTDSLVVVEFAGVTIADTRRATRVLETSQAPAFYIPPDDVDLDRLEPVAQRTFCEWKGQADYLDIVVGERMAAAAAWRYRQPTPRFESITGHLAFYASRVDACWVDGETVTPMEGDFYGGWVTSKVVGPFKGAAGTMTW
jgi:uncharacterized protein (DUF427 family)